MRWSLIISGFPIQYQQGFFINHAHESFFLLHHVVSSVMQLHSLFFFCLRKCNPPTFYIHLRGDTTKIFSSFIALITVLCVLPDEPYHEHPTCSQFQGSAWPILALPLKFEPLLYTDIQLSKCKEEDKTVCLALQVGNKVSVKILRVTTLPSFKHILQVQCL